MRRKKLMIIILIVLLAVLITMGVTVTVFALNNTPQKLFLKGVDNLFSLLETEENYNTLDSTIELSATIDSENEEYDEIKKMLESYGIVLKTKADLKNNVLNSNVLVNYQTEDTTSAILDVDMLLQDNKLYVLYEEIFDKYIEIPYETEETTQVTNTLDIDTLLEEVKNTLKEELKKQDFDKEKVTLNLDGKDIKLKKNTINLSEKETLTIIKNMLQSLNANNKFLNSLGSYKEEWNEEVSTLLETLEEELEYAEEKDELAISLYTKGMFNEFVKFDIVPIQTEESEKDGIEITKINDSKYTLVIYGDGEQFYINVENKEQSKTSGQLIITIGTEEETIEINCQYSKTGSQTTFTISTIIEETPFTIEGTINEEDTSIMGDVKLKVGIEEDVAVVLILKYNSIYDVNVDKQDVSDNVLLDDLTTAQQEEIVEKFEKSSLYKIIEKFGIAYDIFSYNNGLISTSNDEPKVSYGNYVVDYTIPDTFESSSFNSSDSKAYYNDNMDSIMVAIEEGTTSEYMKSLENDEALSNDEYKGQTITNIDKHVVADREFSYRAVLYTYDNVNYMKICFAHKLDDETIYVVVADGERNKITMSEIEEFLSIGILKNTEDENQEDDDLTSAEPISNQITNETTQSLMNAIQNSQNVY